MENPWKYQASAHVHPAEPAAASWPSNSGSPPNLSAMSQHRETFAIFQIFLAYIRELFYCLSERGKANPIKHPRQLPVFHVTGWERKDRNISFNDHIKTLSNDALPSKDMGSEGAVGNLS